MTRRGSLQAPFHLRRPSEDRLARSLEEQAARSITCPDAGSSPADRRYRSMRDEVVLGRGPDLFVAARAALCSWAMHRGAGFHVVAEDERAGVGSSVLLTYRLAAVYVTVACRVVERIDEPNRAGFAYATLPLHAECGRQSFVAEIDETGVVTFVVASLSRPRGTLTRLGRPVASIEQRRAAQRYLRSLRAIAQAGTLAAGDTGRAPRTRGRSRDGA